MEVRRINPNMNMNMNMRYYESYGGNRSMTVSKSKSRGGCFGLESVAVMVGLAASLLILPVVLPPLPPPPPLLLLLPIFILGVLMVFAFVSSSPASTVRRKTVV